MREAMDNIPERLTQYGYALVPSLIPMQTAEFLHLYARTSAAKQPSFGDSLVPGTPSFHGDHAMELLLRSLLPKMEELTGKRLYPTYAYYRVYKTGDILRRHRDREACEYSLTVCLGYEGASTWPIFIEGPKGQFAAKLTPSDALLYKGIDCAHWREAYDGTTASQVFLHYVDQNGPYKEWRYDKRPDLGIAMD